MAILQFHVDGNDWLSNFYPAEFVWDGIVWPTSEHAYQAAKVLDRAARILISRLPSAGKAKQFGKTVELDPDWDSKKIKVMTSIIRAKFTQNPDLMEKLLATGNERIEEGNHWGDRFWGVSPAGSDQGMNHLGEILMELREEFRNA